MLWRLIALASPAFTGVLLFFSFPRRGHHLLAWFCFVPFILTVSHLRSRGDSWRNVARCGLITGLVAYSGLFSWIFPVFQAAGEPPFFAAIAIVILASYLALYLAVFAMLIPAKLSVRAIVGCAAAWVVLEMIRSTVLTGFPWALLGHTQYTASVLIQAADIGGVYLLSFILMYANLTVASIADALLRVRRPNHAVLPMGIFIGILGVLLWYGRVRLNVVESQIQNSKTAARGVRIVLLQPNIDQYKKWDEQYAEEIRHTFADLVRSSAHNPNDSAETLGSATLFVWPESAIPGYLFEEQELFRWLQSLIVESTALSIGPVYHLVGAVGTAGHGKSWNMAVLFDGKGNARTVYRKIRLVPFGEFVPLKQVLGSVIEVINQLGEFERGTEMVVFHCDDTIPPFATMICYESIFPDMAAQFARRGAQFFVNITNDGWYLHTDCPYHHYSFNVFRSVETRRYLVRAANTGISAVVSPSGKARTKDLMTRGVLSAFIHPGAEHGETVYVRTEQWHWILYLSAATLALWSAPRKKKHTDALRKRGEEQSNASYNR